MFYKLITPLLLSTTDATMVLPTEEAKILLKFKYLRTKIYTNIFNVLCRCLFIVKYNKWFHSILRYFIKIRFHCEKIKH